MSDKKKSKPRTKKTTKKIFVDVKGVSKSYQMGEIEVQALKNVSLVLGLGEIISIVGPSGSGKTTLLNVIGALDYVDSGSISINRKKLSSMSDKELSFLRRDTIGYIFQNFNLLEEINAEKNIEMPLILAKLEKEDRKKRVEELLECVDLIERRTHNPDQLSGGEQQRVAIARALANNPKLLLADEPTGNLDSITGEKVLKLLIDLSKNQNKTLIYVTHDVESATLADRQLYMSDGKIVKDISSK
ncbi:MAG: ABC transporter ATP-binding protein [Candidatus Heimdallarchaeota archaeon]|nr:ABC transporter ATP-binding protein [Candidatus Heimdallarchaeota archaeon]MCG3257179.1 ABC transporter ATP-binding protein [Candidatus Heimdallarchaeota archaeon]MCK4612239.1 ABC transporter ATP-binding protein [Candidatus Heimdallarchaeota archaeon]